jgi:hypothetical protein
MVGHSVQVSLQPRLVELSSSVIDLKQWGNPVCLILLPRRRGLAARYTSDSRYNS